MLRLLKSFFKPKEPPASATEAPYKVETPEPVKCGCGRSPTGNCVGLHKLSESEWAAHADNPAKALKKPRAKKAPVAAMTAAEKPKKPRAKKSKE